MESKQTFGQYIRDRRRALGLTQREFAETLYVTESAVSKWERGLSYPDITLLLDICAALDVTEHELLTASVDTQKRSAERLAEKYQRLTRGFCIFMCLIFVGVLVGCGIACAVSSSLWILPIGAAAVMTAGSLTVLPFLLARRPAWEPYKWAAALGSMVCGVEALVLFCCARAGSMNWYPTVSMWILTGSALVLLPVILPAIPLPAALARRRASLYAAVILALLLLTMFAMSWEPLHGVFRPAWFAVAASAVCFGLGFAACPIFLRQLPLPEPFCRCKTSLFLGIQTVLLLLLLTACCRYAGGTAWAMCPIVLASVVFGLSTAFLPIPLRQLPLPEPLRRHRALTYFAAVTALLFAMLAVIAHVTGNDGQWFFALAVPLALLGLVLPWGLMGIIRYLPVNGWFRASLCCVWTGLWSWLYPWFVDKIMLLNGWVAGTPYRLLLPVDFSRWQDPRTAGWNCFLLALLALGALAAGLAAAGVLRGRRPAAR